MTPRRRRLLLVLGIMAGVSVAGVLVLSAFRQNVDFYFVPTQVVDGKVHPGETFRMGGLVAKGSVYRKPGSMEIHFDVTDLKNEVPVVHGKLLPDGVFLADQVLAKHNQYYRPPGIHQAWGIRHGEPRDPALYTPQQSRAIEQLAANNGSNR